MSKLTLKEKEKFLRKRNQANKIIKNEIKKGGGVIFGARSVNVQVKPHLRSQTEDFDLFIKKNPKGFAKKIERKLDKKFKGNFYETKEAQHGGTYKVSNRLSGKGVADVSEHPKMKIRVVKRKGVKYAHTDFQKEKIKESLADPKSAFRHQKDKFSRLRISLAEKTKPKKRKKTKSRVIKTKKTRTSKINSRVFKKINF